MSQQDVLDVLEKHGGRAKIGIIVESIDINKITTYQNIYRLEAEGLIEWKRKQGVRGGGMVRLTK